MVHVDDNRVLEERSFSDALKPEAVFDIGIIVSRCRTQSRYTCPQCSAVNYKNTPHFTNKWIWWYVVRLALLQFTDSQQFLYNAGTLVYHAVAAKSKPPESPKSFRQTQHRGYAP